MNKELIYICIAAAAKCKYVTLNGKKHFIPYLAPEPDKLTSNVLKLYPDISTFQAVPIKHRIRFIKTPIELSWIFMYKNKPFNFYPIFLYLTRLRAGGVIYSPQRKLNLYDCFEIQRNYEPLKTIQP